MILNNLPRYLLGLLYLSKTEKNIKKSVLFPLFLATPPLFDPLADLTVTNFDKFGHFCPIKYLT